MYSNLWKELHEYVKEKRKRTEEMSDKYKEKGDVDMVQMYEISLLSFNVVLNEMRELEDREFDLSFRSE